MPAAKALVICKSVHRQNTARVAERIAGVLGRSVVTPDEVPYACLDDYELVGFGSGVYYGAFHEAMWRWLRGLPAQRRLTKRAFVFSTSGLAFLWPVWHRAFKRELARKGFRTIGEFHCRGFDTWGPLWIAGGINRRHPDERDLNRAAEFAAGMARSIRQPTPTPL